MQRALLVVTLLVSLGMVALAQHGTAPMGYYPMGYNGDMWTGQVTGVNDDTREITLSYTDPKHNKNETFVGVLEQGYKVQVKTGGEHELKVSEIPLGTRLRVLYLPKTRKVEGKKVKYYEIFRITPPPPEKN